MKFEQDDLDWALGELLALFQRANRTGVYPHELEPALFFGAWGLVCAQRFEVSQHWHSILLDTLTLPYPIPLPKIKKRYAHIIPP